MKISRLPALVVVSALGLALHAVATTAHAQQPARSVFNRISTFEAVRNLPPNLDRSKKSIAEIVAATADGRLLVYVDGEQKSLGFVDIERPSEPMPAGLIQFGDGEPTSVAIRGNHAFGAVDTSPSKDKPSGYIAVVDIKERALKSRCELGGQPDSVVVTKDGRFLVIAVENERDEEKDKGKMPQLPAGWLGLIPLNSAGLDCAGLKRVELTGLAEVAPEDPEPEFVDVNGRGEIVVTLQENNHIAIVEAATGRIVSHFSAGRVTIDKVDAKGDGVIRATGKLENIPREPDAVKWLDDDRFVVANEGDYQGGSRSFTIFNRKGEIEFDSGNLLEHIAMRVGHFPERRAGRRGNEPEGVETAVYGGQRYIFIGSERASIVTVWRDNGPGKAPDYVQVLPTGTAPEGLLTIPSRNLLVVAGEADKPAGGPRSGLSIYAFAPGAMAYPTIQSVDGADGVPIGWGALSGLAADRTVPARLYAVTDATYAEAKILTIDASRRPARIQSEMTVQRGTAPAKNLDLEGIAVRRGGGFWLASEGNPERKEGALPNLLVRTDSKGVIEEEIALPESVARHAKRHGLHGVAVTGDGPDEIVWLIMHREFGDDPAGHVKILSYRVATREWGVLHYPLETSRTAARMGVSEIVATGSTSFAVIERDDQNGAASIKRIYAFSTRGMKPVAPGAGPVPVVKKTLVRDVKPDLARGNGIVLEKLEGLAIDAAGDAFVVTDNAGADGTSGETQFLKLGRLAPKR